jgi:hypothetical protein
MPRGHTAQRPVTSPSDVGIAATCAAATAAERRRADIGAPCTQYPRHRDPIRERKTPAHSRRERTAGVRAGGRRAARGQAVCARRLRRTCSSVSRLGRS